MHFLSYTLLLVSFLYSSNSFSNTKNCKEYAIQTQKEHKQYNEFCEEGTAENSPLFPEFNELIAFRKTHNQELTDKDYISPEIAWCNFTNNKRTTELQRKRLHAINTCKNEFQKLYGHASKTIAGLIPNTYQMLPRKEVLPIQYDFNNDGIKDSIFIIVKTPNSTKGRLLIALSQPNREFKSIPVAPYQVGNNGKESGHPYTTLTLQKPDRFILTTQSLDNNNWDSREEWVFKYESNDFKLSSYSSGYTSKSYDISTEEIDKSIVYQFDKRISYISEEERCDYYSPKKPHYKCNSLDKVFHPKLQLGIRNFIDVNELLQ